MSIEIRLGQLHTHGENLKTNNDAGSFLGDVVFEAPSLRGEEIGAVGAKGNANEGCQRRFGEVKAITDEGAEEGVEEEEGGKD